MTQKRHADATRQFFSRQREMDALRNRNTTRNLLIAFAIGGMVGGMLRLFIGIMCLIILLPMVYLYWQDSGYDRHTAPVRIRQGGCK